MPTTDLEQQSAGALALVDGSDFRDRVEPLLPDTIPFNKFAQIAKTAIRNRPELVEADPRSLFNALIYLAQLGLPPDGKKAALNVYNTKTKVDGRDVWVKKVEALPMVSGVIDVASEYGWSIRAQAVYAADEFDVTDEPPALMHKRARPGVDRGELVATYAIAVKDGVRYQEVLYAEDVAKRRAKAKTDKIWNEWTESMWRKSAVHALFRRLPKSELDRMERLKAFTSVEDTDPTAAAELLYGPDGTKFTAIAAPESTHELPSGSVSSEERQQAAAPLTPSGAAAPGDDEPEPTLELNGRQEADLRAAAELAASTEIPVGAYKGMTLEQVRDAGDAGETWLWWALRNASKFDDDFNAALETFVQGTMPDLQARYDEWRTARAAA